MSANTTFFVAVKRQKVVDDIIEVQAVTTDEATEIAYRHPGVIAVMDVSVSGHAAAFTRNEKP